MPDDINASEADVASLFANLPLPQMNELDDVLLAHASSTQNQVQGSNPAEAQGRVPGGVEKQGEFTVDSQQSTVVPFRQRDSFRHVLPRVFAAAAVVVLAVVVVPLIQQPPDSFSTNTGSSSCLLYTSPSPRDRG